MEDYRENLHKGATPKIFENGRILKQNLTVAEFMLWEALRGRRLNGFKFRRQHPINKFIADFYCHEPKLIIELDGGIHELKENKEYDIERSEELERLGIKVIRFKNEDVLGNLDWVLKQIRINLTPSPSP
jgi:very-short-patch-repair endonuclease